MFPLEQFFARRGQADAVTTVAKYESWGGRQGRRVARAGDGDLHPPRQPPEQESKVRTLWLHDVAILPRPTAVPGAEVTSVIQLDEIVEGEHDWRFSRGEEFPGAKGSLTVVKDEPAPGKSCLKLAGDFTGGGAYVAAIKDLRDLDVKDVAAFRLRVKSDNAASLGIQLVDGTGQTHQRKRIPIAADGQWHDLVIKPVGDRRRRALGRRQRRQVARPAAQLVALAGRQAGPEDETAGRLPGRHPGRSLAARLRPAGGIQERF